MDFKKAFLIFCVVGLSACASRPITYTYAPTSKLNVEGELAVGDFVYLPAENGVVKPNQIRNTALGSAIFEKNIGEYIEEAVFLESRVVGIRIDESAKTVKGEIIEFLIDDLGFSVDWTLEINYMIDDCYDETHKILTTTGKFGDIFGHLSTVIKLNIDTLFSDPRFVGCINNGFVENPTRSVSGLVDQNEPAQAAAPLNEYSQADSAESRYPALVEELNSRSPRIMRDAAKKIGEERLFNDEQIILASINVLERTLEEGVNADDRYHLDGLAWCALNLGNSGDRRSIPVLTDIANSDFPKKVVGHAKHALKQFGVDN